MKPSTIRLVPAKRRESETSGASRESSSFVLTKSTTWCEAEAAEFAAHKTSYEKQYSKTAIYLVSCIWYQKPWPSKQITFTDSEISVCHLLLPSAVQKSNCNLRETLGLHDVPRSMEVAKLQAVKIGKPISKAC